MAWYIVDALGPLRVPDFDMGDGFEPYASRPLMSADEIKAELAALRAEIADLRVRIAVLEARPYWPPINNGGAGAPVAPAPYFTPATPAPQPWLVPYDSPLPRWTCATADAARVH